MSLSDLTARQQMLARLAARGYTSSEAAHVLGISEPAVRDELDTIYDRLDIDRHADLVELVRASPEALPAGFTNFDWSSITRGRTG